MGRADRKENGPGNRVGLVPPAHNRAVCMRTVLSPPPIPPRAKSAIRREQPPFFRNAR